MIGGSGVSDLDIANDGATQRPKSRRRRIITAISAALVVAVFGTIYAVVVTGFLQRQSHTGSFSTGEFPKNDGVQIIWNIVSVDPSQHQMTVQLSFQPFGMYADSQGRLTMALSLAVGSLAGVASSAGGGVDRMFAANQDMSPTEATLALNGEPDNYPLEHLTSEYTGSFTTAAHQEVPTITTMNLAVSGFTVDATKSTLVGSALHEVPSNSTQDHVFLHIQPAFATVFFSLFIMALMWALALAAVAMAVILIHRDHAIGAVVLGFLAALLFAFPQIRVTALPGSPPIGSLIDYLSFFWAEAIVAMVLLFLSFIWLKRGGGAEQ
jgi:Domain of unknown function (DUF4436)